MRDAVVLVGVGEMGGVFARGVLRTSHPVIPVTRKTDINAVAQANPDPQLVLVSVGENDLHPTLETIPAAWHKRIGLLQNELLPRDWQQHNFSDPTVISVWFEKKKGQDYKVLISSPAYGPQAELLVDALASLDIPAHVVGSENDMQYELVRKNVYILTTNIAGLVTGGTVEHLWNDNKALAEEVANEVMDIQEYLTQSTYDRNRLMDGFVEGINGDLEHKCMGRSAPGRLARALQHADEADLAVPRLREIQANHTD